MDVRHHFGVPYCIWIVRVVSDTCPQHDNTFFGVPRYYENKKATLTLQLLLLLQFGITRRAVIRPTNLRNEALAYTSIKYSIDSQAIRKEC